jgi:hypothetical protein
MLLALSLFAFNIVHFDHFFFIKIETKARPSS